MPNARQALRAVARAFSLRCPNCGDGWVLTKLGRVRPRCTVCGFRFERTEENYFSGAMFFGLLMGEAILGLSILIICLAMSPNVPWDFLQWAAPVGVLVVMIAVIPVSRVVWLAVDMLVRPVQPEELVG